jgi:flagellar hook-associated protein 3 FlgL
MRITNSMMSNSYLYDLNGNLNRLSKLLEQEATGKAINSISDDPVRTTQSLTARNRLSAVGRYQANIQKADNWLTEIDESVSELNGILGDAYDLAVRASTDTLNDSDLQAIAEEVAAYRDEVLSTANATCGDSYLFAGYNTTGTSTGELPYTIDTHGDLYYNGINMSNEASRDYVAAASSASSEALGDLAAADASAQAASPSSYNEIIASATEAAGSARDVAAAVKTALGAAGDIAASGDIDAPTAAALTTVSGTLQTCADDLAFAIRTADNALSVAQSAADAAEEAYASLHEAIGAGDSEAIAQAQSVYDDAVLTAQNAAADVQTASAALLTAATGAANVIDDGDPGTTTDVKSIVDASTALADASAALDAQHEDVLAVQVGSGQTIGVTIPGTQLLGRGEENLYAILDGFYNALVSGEDASELGGFVSRLQDAQSRVLAQEAGIGAKIKRLDLLSARYEANVLNYTQMKSDAEDADMAEVITNYATAQTVYNAALSAGSEIIQTSLIDFLR